MNLRPDEITGIIKEQIKITVPSWNLKISVQLLPSATVSQQYTVLKTVCPVSFLNLKAVFTVWH